jgi:hypothetical protein
MNKFLLSLFICLPLAIFAQLPDTTKPKKSDIKVDTSEFWKDSLFKNGNPKIWRDGEVVRPPKPRAKRRKFKIRYSDRIQYPVLGDFNLGVSAGVPTILTLQKKLTAWEDSIIPIKYRGDTTWHEHKMSIWLRAARLLLIDAPIETIVMALEQDLYGQMGRAREYGIDGYNYRFGAPIPFWTPMNKLSFEGNIANINASRQELAMMAGGALEAGNMAMEDLSIRWLQRKSMYYREALHYFRLQTAAIASVMNIKYGYFNGSNSQIISSKLYNDSLKNFPNFDASKYFDFDAIYPNNPAGHWLNHVNRNYGFMTAPNYTPKELKRDFALATFTNPWLYYTSAAIFKSYLFEGKDSIPIPQIKLGYGKTVLPWIRYGFTPFGGEWIPEATYTKHRQAYTLYGRFGTGSFKHNTFRENFGAGFKAYNLRRSKKVCINAHLSYWSQDYLYNGPEGDKSQNTLSLGWGAGGTVTGYFKLSKTWQHSLSAVVTAGYKTRGYMEGEMWNSGPILRAGLSFNLDRDYEQDDSIAEYEEVPKKMTRKDRQRLKEKEKKAARKKYSKRR